MYFHSVLMHYLPCTATIDLRPKQQNWNKIRELLSAHAFKATARFSPSWGEKKRGRGEKRGPQSQMHGLIDISIRPLITIFRTIKGKAEFMTGV